MAGEFQGMGQRLRGAAGKSRERDSHFAADPVDADAALRELVGILEAACLRAAVGAVSETARGAGGANHGTGVRASDAGGLQFCILKAAVAGAFNMSSCGKC